MSLTLFFVIWFFLLKYVARTYDILIARNTVVHVSLIIASSIVLSMICSIVFMSLALHVNRSVKWLCFLVRRYSTAYITGGVFLSALALTIGHIYPHYIIYKCDLHTTYYVNGSPESEISFHIMKTPDNKLIISPGLPDDYETYTATLMASPLGNLTVLFFLALLISSIHKIDINKLLKCRYDIQWEIYAVFCLYSVSLSAIGYYINRFWYEYNNYSPFIGLK